MGSNGKKIQGFGHFRPSYIMYLVKGKSYKMYNKFVNIFQKGTRWKKSCIQLNDLKKVIILGVGPFWLSFTLYCLIPFVLEPQKLGQICLKSTDRKFKIVCVGPILEPLYLGKGKNHKKYASKINKESFIRRIRRNFLSR